MTRVLLILGALLACALHACSLAPATVYVHDSMWPVKGIIEDEAREAIEFFCDAQGIRDCGKWQLDLKVYIVPGPSFPCGSVEAAVGCYTKKPGDSITVVWANGPGENAMLHELYHRRLAKLGDPKWHEHPVAFLLIVKVLKEEWRVDHE
jgi:hypothetical protein